MTRAGEPPENDEVQTGGHEPLGGRGGAVPVPATVRRGPGAGVLASVERSGHQPRHEHREEGDGGQGGQAGPQEEEAAGGGQGVEGGAGADRGPGPGDGQQEAEVEAQPVDRGDLGLLEVPEQGETQGSAPACQGEGVCGCVWVWVWVCVGVWVCGCGCVGV